MEHIKGKKDMIMEQHLIYLDNAATTKVNPKVLDAMLPYFCEKFGNASPIYSLAAESKKAITEGREQIAHVLGADPSEIYFTGGGSESDNWALKATAEAYQKKESISSPRRSSIMQSSIPVSIWRRSGALR